jgi:hypothetical protein
MKMTGTHKLAQLLVSCWRLSGDSRKIPTSRGVLDRALKIACEQGNFPDWARTTLHFVDSRIGLQCVELPSILDWSQRSQLTTAPNPSYESSEIQISPRVASRLLSDLSVSDEEAKLWGEQLRSATKEAEKDLQKFETASIEDY